MGKNIWSLLAEYGGRWVAVDAVGRVAAYAETFPELIRLAKGSPSRLTLLYAAPEPALRS